MDIGDDVEFVSVFGDHQGLLQDHTKTVTIKVAGNIAGIHFNLPGPRTQKDSGGGGFPLACSVVKVGCQEKLLTLYIYLDEWMEKRKTNTLLGSEDHRGLSYMRMLFAGIHFEFLS